MPRRGLSWGVQYLWSGIAFLYLACAQAQNNQHENTTVISPASSGARLAIIIDDIGYN